MAGVEVVPIPGRVGQQVRNELIFENTGGGGAARQSTYKLDIVIKESVTDELVRSPATPPARSTSSTQRSS